MLAWFEIIFQCTRSYLCPGDHKMMQSKPNHSNTNVLTQNLNLFHNVFFEGHYHDSRHKCYDFYTPRNEVRGGILESPCPSVHPSVCPSVRPSVCPAAFGFPAHNCFPFTPIIMKLHMQTPHEARMCPIDFEVKRSKVKVTMHKLPKMVSGA